MPPLEIQVFSPSSTIAVAVAASRSWQCWRRPSRMPARTTQRRQSPCRRGFSAAMRRAARRCRTARSGRRRAPAWQRRNRPGRRGAPAFRGSAPACARRASLAVARRRRDASASRRGRAARPVRGTPLDVVMIDLRKIVGRPRFQPLRQLAVARLEKRPVEEALVRSSISLRQTVAVFLATNAS